MKEVPHEAMSTDPYLNKLGGVLENRRYSVLRTSSGLAHLTQENTTEGTDINHKVRNVPHCAPCLWSLTGSRRDSVRLSVEKRNACAVCSKDASPRRHRAEQGRERVPLNHSICCALPVRPSRGPVSWLQRSGVSDQD
ncbi:hypothetical protein CPAR01_13333 [Colletotrichum paranaense]|uniref:Uncharacterized protein n=1 Tax=Colletotrichum paranaense TaxID=1914294 RepID=A0ABQ9S5P5_9PEZI|nr:uncharacterized protein CPAR01_13333 [Colletotrichum paranaense]KAK1526805.1 hypothetical protein CPAR01_13333 [Colletotrichum paranaense]